MNTTNKYLLKENNGNVVMNPKKKISIPYKLLVTEQYYKKIQANGSKQLKSFFSTLFFQTKL